jgi:hypothetical protein
MENKYHRYDTQYSNLELEVPEKLLLHNDAASADLRDDEMRNEMEEGIEEEIVEKLENKTN